MILRLVFLEHRGRSGVCSAALSQRPPYAWLLRCGLFHPPAPSATVTAARTGRGSH
ncbi:hypothetical protein EES40_09715 [Streptomyces sp. ADI93-02]|nr:hypothetical protein EES40_09715 [Streptomyces sp. ADI93-02]